MFTKSCNPYPSMGCPSHRDTHYKISTYLQGETIWLQSSSPVDWWLPLWRPETVLLFYCCDSALTVASMSLLRLLTGDIPVASPPYVMSVDMGMYAGTGIRNKSTPHYFGASVSLKSDVVLCSLYLCTCEFESLLYWAQYKHSRHRVQPKVRGVLFM